MIEDRMKRFLLFLCMFICSTAQALELKTNLSSYSYMIAAEENPVVYHFSDDLLKAAKNCTVYSEDFSKNNPELIKYEDIFGGALFVYVNIKGKKEDKCIFDVNTQYGVLGRNFYHCQLSEEQHQNFIKVMDHGTSDLMTETYDSIIAIKDEKGNILKKEFQPTTLTSTRFNIEWLKILNQACDITQDSFSESEQLEQNFTLNELPFKFIASLKRCVPALATRHLLALDIKGWVKGECVIDSGDFMVSISPEMTKKIKTWDDMYDIIKNEKFSHYHYEKKDYVSGLLLAIQACADYEKNHEAVDLLSDEQIKINRGVISEYSDEICNVQLINQVSFGEDMRDYGKECRLYPLDVQGIIKRYSDLLEKHKKLQLEKDVALETEVSVDMLAADKEIMAYLNEHSFCRRNSPETNH